MSKLRWAQWSHGGTTGMCLPLETTTVKMGCWIGRMPWKNMGIRENCWIMVLRTVFPGHPGNSMPFNPSPTVTQSPFISPSQKLCWLCFVAPCPIPLVSIPQHAGFAPGVAGASLSLGHLLFYFLDLDGIGKHNQSYRFPLRIFYMSLSLSQLFPQWPTHPLLILVEQFIIFKSYLHSQAIVL